MSKLVNAMKVEGNETVTEKGMATYKSSLNACVDFFFQAGASRGQDVTSLYIKAFNEEQDLAVRLALWLRDVRGGAGERQLFKDVFNYIVNKDTELAKRVLVRVPELGRWDDVLVAFGSPLEKDALYMIHNALKAKDGLCAKWMPRPAGSNKEHRVIANKIRSYMDLTPKEYRKLLAELSDTVEQKMCSKAWDDINYSHVPSLAAARYQAAFAKADPIGYTTYREGLKKGDPKVKVNAKAVYPYDIVKSVRHGDQTVADAQWAALPDYLGGSDANIMPMVDVSGSMTSPAGGKGVISCLDVAISLGLYISERSEGIFKDSFLTFSTRPELVTVQGSLSDRIRTMSRANWDMSTNLEGAFDFLLNAAVKHKVPAEEMPTQLLILSDMQFDHATGGSGYGRSSTRWNPKVMEMIRAKYEAAGYTMPQIVYWNIRAVHGQSPVTADENGTALVSGFSPSIMATVLGADPAEFTPRAMMLKALQVSRYDY